MRLTFWLGAEGDSVWREHLNEREAEAERLRHRPEAVDE